MSIYRKKLSNVVQPSYKGAPPPWVATTHPRGGASTLDGWCNHFIEVSLLSIMFLDQSLSPSIYSLRAAPHPREPPPHDFMDEII